MQRKATSICAGRIFIYYKRIIYHKYVCIVKFVIFSFQKVFANYLPSNSCAHNCSDLLLHISKSVFAEQEGKGVQRCGEF